MEIHLRINNSANRLAVQDLEPYAYKILMCLSNYADSLGVCFPSPETIAEQTKIGIDCVYEKLKHLASMKYIKYLRKACYDHLTKKSSPAVFQVSPYFLEIAAANLAEATKLWDGTSRLLTGSNQQQNQVSETTTFNQLQETTTTLLEKQPIEPPTAKSEKPKRNDSKQPERLQRSSPNENSAIVKKYTNVIRINDPLPDELSERLVQRLTSFNIAAKLGRGLIHHFGYQAVESAANYTEFCSTFQDIRNRGGFLRDVLETGVVDYQERVNEYDQYLES